MKFKRFKRGGGVVVGILLAATMLAGCSQVRTTEFSIGYVIKGGVDDSRGISKILMPGSESSTESDDDIVYIYANSRNWNVQQNPDADVDGLWKANGKPSGETGEIPGYEMEGQGITPFAVNRPDGTDACTEDSKSEPCRALYGFYQYCEKYDCGNDPDADTEKQDLSSDPGWMTMLREGWGQALDHAWRSVIAGYGPEVANDPKVWGDIGKQMGELAFEEMSSIVGLPKGVHIFCDPDVISGEKCHAPTVKIHNIASPQAAALLVTQRDAANTAINAANATAADKQAQLDKINAAAAVQTEQNKLDQQRAADTAALLNTPGYQEKLQADRLLAQIQACAGKCIINFGAAGNTTTQIQIPAG